MGPTFSPDSETALIEGTVCMISPLYKRFQKTHLERTRLHSCHMKTLEERQLHGAGDHEKMPEGKTAIWVSFSKDRDRRQVTLKPFQLVNLLRTTVVRELLSPRRQFTLSMAMDQKKSSFFPIFQMTEIIFFFTGYSRFQR